MTVDEDDEDTFGDFSFAPSNYTVHSNHKMTSGSGFTASNNDNDDDWGEFIINSGGLPHALSLPKTSTPLPSFGSFTDQNQKKAESEPIQPGSAPGRVNLQWEKPKGALPLSIFGDLEDEEEDEKQLGAGGSWIGDKGASFFSNKDMMEKKKDGSSSVKVNDLIANLYKQREPGNGSAPDFNGSDLDSRGSNSGEEIDKNEPTLNSHGLDSVTNWNWLNANSNGLNVNDKTTYEQKLSPQGSSLEWNPLNLGPIGSTSASKEVNLSANGVITLLGDGSEGFDEDDGDDDGWEFQGAESKTAIGDENSKDEQIMTENVSDLNWKGSDSSWDVLLSDSNKLSSNLSGMNSSWKHVKSNLVVENKDVNDVDGWGFKCTDSSWDVLHSNSNKLGSDLSGMSLNGKQVKSDLVYENKDSNDADGWGFKRTDSSWDVLHSSSNRFSSNLSVVNWNGKQVKSDIIDENKDLHDADGWGFKGAESEFHLRNGNTKDDMIKTENGPAFNFNESNFGWNVLSLNVGAVGGLNSNLNGTNLDSKPVNLNLVDENVDLGEEDGWEFKAAESETRARDGHTKDEGRRLENSEGTVYPLGFDNVMHGSGDLFGASQLTSQKSSVLDFGFNYNPGSFIQDGTTSNIYSKSEQNDNENSLSEVDGEVDSDEDSWAFKDAFSELGLKDREPPQVAGVSAAVDASAFDGETKNKARQENHEGALPLFIFGDEEEEPDPVIYEDISSQMPVSIPGSSIKTPINISDLISSLYIQAEQNTSVSHAPNLNENGFGSSETLTALHLSNDNDNFDDDSWEFKDASGMGAEDQAFVLGPAVSSTKYSTQLELDDYVDVFSKLKEELHFVALLHLENLKKAQNAAASEDANAQALDKEIQDLNNEQLHQNGMISGEVSENHSARKICLDEIVKVLQEPKFQVLDSEYQLSKKLPLVSNDLGSSIELLKQVTSIEKILKLASMEEQSSYVSTWSKMLSVCVQELEHGALIWKQSIQKNVHHQILSKPQGQRYILALGEIYRVVEILGSSARLFKPWILASSTDPIGVFTLISECSTLWSSSGLEEALQSISDPAGFAYDGSPKSLLESIKHIHNLDALTLYNHMFSGQDPVCRLSILTAGMVPGMKTVVWNGESYFIRLANLWANLMSSDPPNLPHIHVG